MKRYITSCILLFIITIPGCTKDFNSINTDPTQATAQQFDPNNLFAAGELGCANVTEYQMYNLSCITQLLASTWSNYSGGDKYDNNIFSSNDRYFSEGYTYAGYLTSAINLAKQKDSGLYNNVIQMSRIMFVLDLQRMTDIYGDVPYFQVGQGQQGVFRPSYDAQSAIYYNMLTTLDDAINKLDPGKPLATGDLMYGGNIAQWKKFGYSVMLRVAMRLVKADPATAQKYAEEAGGKTFTTIADNAIVPMDGLHDLSTNKTASLIHLIDFEQIRWGKTFIDYLKNTNDPRLYSLTEKTDTGLAFNNDLTHPGLSYTIKNPAPAGSVNEVPIGMPNGYLLDSSSQSSYIRNALNYPGSTGTGANVSLLGNYARPVMKVFSRKDLPLFLITYAQTEFLLAEAAVRGWNVGGTASGHFTNGVGAAIEALPQWDASLTISQNDISAFVNGFPLDISSQSNSLNQINSQYWLTSIFDFIEAWSNWRRSGYPVLTPVNYQFNVTNGAIPRRLTYPSSEKGANPQSYQSAVQKLGGVDLPTLRVWWDKQ
ncbi:MAG TPA: SusD/RagB family nutrient-binding outer membrane lipoprotein [Puia sp.]|nr:SusD/RagB family nutrient-binding outer membrane lipoprotein [Puia sp.]